jgi:hypothetical protein
MLFDKTKQMPEMVSFSVDYGVQIVNKQCDYRGIFCLFSFLIKCPHSLHLSKHNQLKANIAFVFLLHLVQISS